MPSKKHIKKIRANTFDKNVLKLKKKRKMHHLLVCTHLKTQLFANFVFHTNDPKLVRLISLSFKQEDKETLLDAPIDAPTPPCAHL